MVRGTRFWRLSVRSRSPTEFHEHAEGEERRSLRQIRPRAGPDKLSVDRGEPSPEHGRAHGHERPQGRVTPGLDLPAVPGIERRAAEPGETARIHPDFAGGAETPDRNDGVEHQRSRRGHAVRARPQRHLGPFGREAEGGRDAATSTREAGMPRSAWPPRAGRRPVGGSRPGSGTTWPRPSRRTRTRRPPIRLPRHRHLQRGVLFAPMDAAARRAWTTRAPHATRHGENHAEAARSSGKRGAMRSGAGGAWPSTARRARFRQLLPTRRDVARARRRSASRSESRKT